MKIESEKYTELQKEVKQYVKSYFNDLVSEKLVYHNLTHTESVVAAATQMAEHYKLSDKDSFIVITASWFHDIGYFTVIDNHEEKGAEMAAHFLKEKGVDAEVISGIKECILATHMPQQPHNLLQEIICDADLFHFGTDEFIERDKLAHKEAEALLGKKIKKKVWNSRSIKLLEGHHFFTDYCKDLLEEKKKTNLTSLKRKQDEKKDKPSSELKKKLLKDVTVINDDQLSEVKAKDAPASRGIQTMFRITSGNNQKLSDMADNKAHIMITVNSIILSIILGVLFRKLSPDNSLIYPSILFIIISLATIVFSILATRPSIPSGVFTKQDLADKKVNLLFFGNFYKMSLDDYSEGMYRVMENRNFLYGSLIKDVYYQGVVLGHKYRLLRISYNIFMYGLIASVAAFLIALMFFTENPLQTALLTPPDSAYKSPAGYNLIQSDKYELPHRLNEVSGIAFNKGNPDTIYTEQDEDAKLFHFKLGDKNELTTKFGKHGDYEDITVCRNNVILLRSDGILVTIPLNDTHQEVTDNAKEWLDLLPKGEYESLGSIDTSGELFVFCKHCKEKNQAKGFVFKISNDGTITPNGNFDIDIGQIEAHLDNKDIDFRPSGLALNPCTKEWFIISSVNKLLVVADFNWKVKDVFPLNPSVFPQPEGIAFDNECNLYISNEKNTTSNGSILKFTYE